MRAELVDRGPSGGPEVRTFKPEDAPALGALMYRAYLDTVDYDGETPEQAAAEVTKTIEGEYGLFIPDCSKVFGRAGSLLSATLVTRFQDRPFVAFTFTDPAFTGQGLARACNASSNVRALRPRGAGASPSRHVGKRASGQAVHRARLPHGGR